MSSWIHLPKLKHTIKPEDFPYVDARFVRFVISGEFDMRMRLGARALPLDSPDTEGPYAVGTRTCPQDCSSINVWGLKHYSTEKELVSLCQGFGAIADIKLFIPEADCNEAWATISFVERLSAQMAQASLHRTKLHGKVRQQQGLVWCTFLNKNTCLSALMTLHCRSAIMILFLAVGQGYVGNMFCITSCVDEAVCVVSSGS